MISTPAAAATRSKNKREFYDEMMRWPQEKSGGRERLALDPCGQKGV
jgi:hypothetical protein